MLKADLEKLYCDQRLSMMEVAKQLWTTHARVLYWMKKHKIEWRSWSDSAYAKQNPKGDPFKTPERLNVRQRELFVAGLLLYWAEGGKTQGAARIVNLDHRMPQLFMRFLREVCHVDERRLSVYVRLYQAFDLETAQRYWAHLRDLHPSQVFVSPPLDGRSKAQQQWSKHGIATLEFHNTKFKQWLNAAIEQYVGRFTTQLANQGRDESSAAGAYRARAHAVTGAFAQA